MKIVGITDEVTHCDCCGRSGLKRTVKLATDSGAVVHYGTTCAVKPLRGTVGIRRTGREIATLAGVAETFQTLLGVIDSMIATKTPTVQIRAAVKAKNLYPWGIGFRVQSNGIARLHCYPNMVGLEHLMKGWNLTIKGYQEFSPDMPESPTGDWV